MSAVKSQPQAPAKTNGPQKNWPHRGLYERVVSAIHALPERFTSALRIEGVPATDLFTMNSALGAAIETSVVESLNDLREMWDPDHQYADYYFVRQAQQFPDVLLTTTNPQPKHQTVLMGIELKGWFLLSKEGEPSFRYKVSANCCSDADLLVVIPWLFNNVVSGTPRLMAPIISEAKFAALQRNYHWEWERGNPSGQPPESRKVTPASYIGFYPPKSARSSDIPVDDSGGNFGRVARCGVMDDEVRARLAAEILGISVDAWRRFLQIFASNAEQADIESSLLKLEALFNVPDQVQRERLFVSELLTDLAGRLRFGS